jgi:hypothetical protein
MGNQLSEQEILNQSKTAYAQWKDKWHAYAKQNGEIFKKSGRKVTQLAYSGYGRQLIVVAMGASLEDHIDLIKKSQKNPLVDIAVVDKGFRDLINHGVIPKYVFLADAGVDFEKWVGDALDKTENVTLVSNITANPEWTSKWKGPVYFYVNRDNIGTHDIFMPLSGCHDLIPASSNVGNSVLVFAVQYLGYDEHLLVGYDFGWNYNGNYYAFNDNDKRFWMKHLQGIGLDGELIYTSGNLQFSRKWLEDFCAMAGSQGVKIFNCSGHGSFNYKPHELKKRLDKFEPRKSGVDIERARLMAMSEKIKFFGDNAVKEAENIMGKNRVIGIEIAYIPASA